MLSEKGTGPLNSLQGIGSYRGLKGPVLVICNHVIYLAYRRGLSQSFIADVFDLQPETVAGVLKQRLGHKKT